MVIYWITHKLVENILRQYDGIIVMHKGQIAEYGTFDELMEMKAKFYSLFMLEIGSNAAIVIKMKYGNLSSKKLSE